MDDPHDRELEASAPEPAQAPLRSPFAGDDDEQRALASLYAEFMGPLIDYLRRKFGAGPPEPEDLAQIAFAQLVNRGTWRDIQDPKAFLRRAASNAAISEHRARNVRKHLLHPVTEDLEDWGSDLTLESVLTDRDLLKKILRFVGRLPEKQRRIFEMSRIEEMSITDIAKREGISRTATRKHLTKACASVDQYLASLKL